MVKGLRVSVLLVMVGFLSSLSARTVSQSREEFSLRNYIDEHIRSRFPDCGELNEIDIQSQQGDLLFHFNYGGGFEIAMRANLATSHIDVIRYFSKGKSMDGRDETLCLIPKKIQNLVLDFSEADITRFLIGNG